MADEIRRVGHAYYVQTPYRYFPIEPHFLFPFFAQLPLQIRAELIRRVALGRPRRRIRDRSEATQLAASVALLRMKELRELFPEATISTERFAGLVKSLIAIHGFPETPPDRPHEHFKPVP